MAMWAFVMSRSMQKASSRMALSSLGSRWTGVGGSCPGHRLLGPRTHVSGLVRTGQAVSSTLTR